MTRGFVRRVIELARRGTPLFTGRAGESDVVLTNEGVYEARGKAPPIARARSPAFEFG